MPAHVLLPRLRLCLMFVLLPIKCVINNLHDVLICVNLWLLSTNNPLYNKRILIFDIDISLQTPSFLPCSVGLRGPCPAPSPALTSGPCSLLSSSSSHLTLSAQSSSPWLWASLGSAVTRMTLGPHGWGSLAWLESWGTCTIGTMQLIRTCL